MMDTFRTVTVRSLPNTAAFGKPAPSPAERRNGLLWGHPSPGIGHKVLVLLAVLSAAAAALVAALSQPAEPRRAQPAVSGTHTSVVIIAPLA